MTPAKKYRYDKIEYTNLQSQDPDPNQTEKSDQVQQKKKAGPAKLYTHEADIFYTVYCCTVPEYINVLLNFTYGSVFKNLRQQLTSLGRSCYL
jgi:hypothetical protein